MREEWYKEHHDIDWHCINFTDKTLFNKGK